MVKGAATTEQTEQDAQTEQTDRAKALSASYAKAGERLKAGHLAEFNEIRAKILLDDFQITWSPRKTDEEKAAAELAALLEKYPDLRSQI